MEKAAIVKEAHDLFFADSSSTSSDVESVVENPKSSNKRRKVRKYEIVQIPEFNDITFKEHFRVNRSVFKILCDEVDAVCIAGYGYGYGPGRQPVSTEKQLMISLWYLGNTESMRSISERFGVCISSVWHIVAFSCGAIIKVNRKKRYVRWPPLNESAKTAAHYKRETRFPGIVGAIDSTHIHIRTPVKHRNNYMNREGIYTILLLGVCNHKLEFMYCYAGEPGSISDSLLLEKSELVTKIDDGNFKMADHLHLLGDVSYPLKKWLITPYPNFSNITEDQHIFNNIHSICRGSIRRAFALLEGRFRRLQFIDSLKPESIVKYIIASCILHNICLTYNDLEEDYISDKESAYEKVAVLNLYDSIAEEKRNNLLPLLFEYE